MCFLSLCAAVLCENVQVAARPVQLHTVYVQVEHLACVVITAVGRGSL